MKRWSVTKRLLPLLTGLVLLLSACGREDLSALNPQGPVAEKQFNLMMLAVYIMTFVVVVVFAISIYVLIKFRRRKGDNSIPKQVEGNHKLEIIWTVIPIILLLVLGFPTIRDVFGLAKDYSKDKDALQVKVTAHQYWWEFEYTDLGITTAQELIVPTDKVVSFELVAGDVKHSFWIPAIGGKMDTNPGVTNRMYLEFPKEGVYRGKCAELCGPAHALMDFKAKSVSPESFSRWVSAMKAPAVMPADAEIAEKFTSQCLSCHAVGENGGNSAPNLTGVGGRLTVGGILYNDEAGVEQNLHDWITDPQKYKYGAMMPTAEDNSLTPEEVSSIAKYLAEYKLDY